MKASKFGDPVHPQFRGTDSEGASLRSPEIGFKVLAFDVFGTVVDWRSGVIATGKRLTAHRGLRVDWASFADAWRNAYAPSMDRVRRGELPWTRLDELHRQTLDELIPRFGLEALPEPDRDELNRAWHALRPWPDAVEGLRRLRNRFTITTLSNGNVSLLTDMARCAGLPWDCILSAELVQHYKPDPEAYLQVPRLLDVKPNQVLMVAAHANDLNAARQSGLRTAFVHRPLEWGPGKAPPRPATGQFDHVAADFLDLAEQLGA